MNIFLPYENDIRASVQSLDDVRLNKQILECYQLLSNAINEKNGEEVKGYKNHPVYVFYKDNLPFLAYYGMCCTVEYCERSGSSNQHRLHQYFVNCGFEYLKSIKFMQFVQPPYTPYYMEGSIKDPNHIRTTENVSALFQAKLCKKWEQDKAKGRPPKWTKCPVPQFYEKFLKENRE